jgi:hypothetical protein
MNVEPVDSVANPGYLYEWWTPRLAGPVIAAAVVRLGLLAVLLVRSGSSLLVSTDTGSYLDPGRNLLLHGRFIADGVPDLFRTPGYPLFLAATSLAGLPFAAFVQVILSLLSVVLFWKLGRAVFVDERIALGAAWIFAFEPIAVTYSVILLSETLFLTLLLLSLERLTEFLRGHRLRVLAAAGVWLAAATFVRPVTYYLPIALALGLFLVLARFPRLRWKAPAVLLLSVLPWLAAWQIRNWVETGYSGFASVAEINLYFLSAPDVVARMEHRSLSDVQDELVGHVCGHGCNEQLYLYQPYLALHPEQAGWSQGQRLAFMHSEAGRVIRAHYGVYLRASLEGLLRVAFRLGSGSFDSLVYPRGVRQAAGFIPGAGVARNWSAFATAYPWAAVEKVIFGIVLYGLYLLAARGVYRLLRGDFHGGIHNACLWLLLGTSFYFFAVIGAGGGTAADSRLRLPIMPAVCIFAAAGFCRIRTTEQPSAQPVEPINASAIV